MRTVDPEIGYLSGRMVDRVTTRGAVDTATTADALFDDASRQQWQEVIDRHLIEWGRHPEQLEDDGADAPDAETIHSAIQLAALLRDRYSLPPHSVIADPNGGIVFERREGDLIERFYVWDDQSIEYLRFEGPRIVARHQLR